MNRNIGANQLQKRYSKTSISIIAIIAIVAIALSMVSYGYSTNTANQILDIASAEAKSNAEIQAHDLSAVLANKVDAVSANLELLRSANALQSQNVEAAAPLFTAARTSTEEFVSSYFWIDKDGKLLWADSFTNKTLAQQYGGADRSYREYFTKPKDMLKPYYSTVIESVDNIPRLYIGYPIIEKGQTKTTTTPAATLSGGATNGTATGSSGIFKGVVVAAIDIDTIGKFVQNLLVNNFKSSAGLMDRNGLILYSSASSKYTGKNIFDPEVQSVIPSDVKDAFNQLIRDSLKGNIGSGDVSSQGITSTIAYGPIKIRGNEFAILYVVTPHQFAGNVVALDEQQRNLNTIIIAAIGAVAAGIAALVLTWNKRLSEQVEAKTSELKSSNQSLIESNEQLKVANTKLQEANEQLKVHDKMQKEFINIAAHELRTPTQAILGFSELMQQQEDLGELKAATAAIFRNANRLQRLTDDILDVTRIESQSLKLDKEKWDLNEKIELAIEDTKSRMLNGNSTQIIFERTEQGILVYADKTRVSQVVSNLLTNALKFTKKGTITVRAEKGKDGLAVVSVKDEGSGIHLDIMPRLFTKFVSNSQTGTGLGLYISKSIVEAHGGSIKAQNNPDGKGATFSFTLPLHDGE